MCQSERTVLSSSVGFKRPIQEHKVACWHGDRGRVGVRVREVGAIEDIREIRNILGGGGGGGGGGGVERGRLLHHLIASRDCQDEYVPGAH